MAGAGAFSVPALGSVPKLMRRLAMSGGPVGTAATGTAFFEENNGSGAGRQGPPEPSELYETIPGRQDCLRPS